MENKLELNHNLLQFSAKEIEILHFIKSCQYSTPLSLSKQCKIPRPTIYVTLGKLKARGLVTKRKFKKRKVWVISDTDKIRKNFENISKLIFDADTNYEKINVGNNTNILIHRGRRNILNIFSKLVEQHNGHRLFGVYGDFSGDAWNEKYSVNEINKINQKIKNNRLITEIVSSKEWFARQAEMFGESWVENFSGRATQTHIIDGKYLKNEGQIFIFKDQIYLVSMREEVFVEVRNKEISKLIISLLKFVEDNSNLVDTNKLLHNLRG